MLELYFILYALFFAKLSCYLAVSKNRNRDFWYLAGFIGGFVAILILMRKPSIVKGHEKELDIREK